MLHEITIDMKYRKNICLLFNNKKYGDDIIRKQASLHENHVDLFKSIEGKAYCVCHGMEFRLSNIIYGYLSYHGDDMTTPEYIYKDLVKRGFIKESEELRIICCFGLGIKEAYERRIREGYAEALPIIFINDTHSKCASSIVKLRNGKIRYVCGTERTDKEKKEFIKAVVR